MMVSSTFGDLAHHRAALIKAIEGQELKAVVMENDSAKADIDVVDSSLAMVGEAAAYVGVISFKYGQRPDCDERNPDRLSLTQLEFNEARRLGRPVLLFIMGDRHDVKRGDVETDPEAIQKLNAFREDAKRFEVDSSVHRVYKVFNDLAEFAAAATQAVAGLRRFLDEQGAPGAAPLDAAARTATPPDLDPEPIPKPPAFYAEPAYIGSHAFVGRKAQLETLSDWASAADPHPVLLFEAIGGTGKSMLTWEWVTKHSTAARDDWAGRFWYSFYERGAIMADFCRRALAYVTGQPLSSFRKAKTRELGKMLLHHLHAAPWLLVLDGLERVLVAYHRFDAAQLADEQAGTSDEIIDRDPCAAIRAEDDDLLRALAGAAPSKLLLTSRLVPRVLLNASSQPIPGVLPERLPGLRPPDAEELLRSCGIRGSSQAIQTYLQSHCDCHPLVTGALAGLIHDYLPDRGNFDAWAADPAGGGQLNLADLNLVQKRNHILYTALAAVPEKGRELLSMLALVSEAVDALTLAALNPHWPPEPERVPEAFDPPQWIADDAPEAEKAQKQWDETASARRQYNLSPEARLRSPEYLAASRALAETVRDLERRGLLQYDFQTRRYDLHPVVRGIAAGRLDKEDKARFGQRVVDHFTQKSHSPYEQAETLEDVRAGLQVVRSYLQMGNYLAAAHAYEGDLAEALHNNLEAHAEMLSLLRPFFTSGWGDLPELLPLTTGGYLANDAALALWEVGSRQSAFEAREASMRAALRDGDWRNLCVDLLNLSDGLVDVGQLARAERCTGILIELASLVGPSVLFMARLRRLEQLTDMGLWAAAEAMWGLLDEKARNRQSPIYRLGHAEYLNAKFRFRRGDLREEHLTAAEAQATRGKTRWIIRHLLALRGEWHSQTGQWALAADSLEEAVRIAREGGKPDSASETQLVIAKLRLGVLAEPRAEAERVSQLPKPAHRALAELWLALEHRENAKRHALLAYEKAWAEGEPFVFRHELDKAATLLHDLGVELPRLAPYDPSREEPFHWEADVSAAMAKLRPEKTQEEQEKQASEEPPKPPT